MSVKLASSTCNLIIIVKFSDDGNVIACVKLIFYYYICRSMYE